MTAREELIHGLRELAMFLEANPEVPEPVGTQLNAFLHDAAALAQLARKGAWEKVYAGDYFCLRRTFAGGIQLDINCSRDRVCERVLVGTREVAAQPAHLEPVYEWRCAGSLLATPESV